LEKPVCRIWLKIGILVDFEVLNKVQIDLNAPAPLLDPVLGHNREPPRNVKRGEKSERKK
jgi:hypothetical protein